METEQRVADPFIGPRPFRRNIEDQIRFFGRDDENEEIVSLILSNKLVLIYGQSGVGKTSILNAAVAPSLENIYGFEVLPVARIGGIGFQNAEVNLKSSSVNAESSHEINPYILNVLLSLAPGSDSRSLLQIKSLSKFLKEYFPHGTNQKGKQIPQLIIFDQMEELLALYLDPQRWRQQQENFFKEVTDALDADPLLRVVFIIREDYLAQLDPFASILPEKLKARFRMERLRKEAAYEAVRGPLERTKVYLDDKAVIEKLFNDDTVESLIEDLLKIRVETFGGASREIIGEFIEPIQLQVVCQRLWNKLRGSQLDETDQKLFKDIGDIDTALQDFYVETIHKASRQTRIDENTIRDWVEIKLITNSGTRGIVHREAETTGGIPNNVLEILEERYLIRGEWRSGARWYELAHDRFIRPIEESNKKWRLYERKRGFKKFFPFAVRLFRRN